MGNIGLILISKSIKDSLDFVIEKLNFQRERNKFKIEERDDECSDISIELRHRKLMWDFYEEENENKNVSFKMPDPEHEWPAALPLQGIDYRGIVTNISVFGVVTFIEETNWLAAVEMCEGIKKSIENQHTNENSKWNWNIGDTCFAKFAEDNQIYRAKIVNFDADKDLYKVITKL